MVALGIRKLSPPASFASVLVVGYGSRCEDRVCRAFARGTITLVQYAAYSGRSSFVCLARDVGGVLPGYHSILITLVRGTLHFTFFPRYVVALLAFGHLVEFEDTANELLFACSMQDTDTDITFGGNFECRPMHSAHRLIPTSTAPSPLARCSSISITCTSRSRELHEPLGINHLIARAMNAEPRCCYKRYPVRRGRRCCNLHF